MARLGALLAVLLGGCGYSNPGFGSGTLRVEADLVYAAGATGQTTVTVVVHNNGLLVQNPNMFLTDGQTGQVFTLTGNNSQVIAGYHRNVQLHVVSGVDNLTTWLEGPGPFTIASPQQGQVYAAKSDLQIFWTTQDGVSSDAVQLTLANSDVQNTLADDSGAFTVAASLLRPGSETLTVLRRTTITPSGGASGSYMRSTYSASTGFKLE